MKKCLVTVDLTDCQVSTMAEFTVSLHTPADISSSGRPGFNSTNIMHPNSTRKLQNFVREMNTVHFPVPAC
jgi:hypothetical protein